MQEHTQSPVDQAPAPQHGAGDHALDRPYRIRVLAEAPARLDDQVLACISHGIDRPDNDPRRISVDLHTLRGPSVELWESATPVRRGVDHGIAYAENGEVLFGQLFLPESELQAMDRAMFHSYALIDGLLQRQGFPEWLRVWNFIAQINAGDADHERYRQFVVGRYKALALKPGFELALPAATAIGTYGGGILIYFLAGRRRGIPMENPRQVSAFRYPRQYGPRSPSFSRAMYLPWADHHDLFVSGTASVVGHQTLHAGRPLRQLDETLANIDSLLQNVTATQPLDGANTGCVPQQVKLYLRDPGLLDQVWEPLRAAFPPETAITALYGDVCRTDLSLELEAYYQRRPA